jgi:ABC-type glutathione transport system ATPase component
MGGLIAVRLALADAGVMTRVQLEEAVMALDVARSRLASARAEAAGSGQGGSEQRQAEAAQAEAELRAAEARRAQATLTATTRLRRWSSVKAEPILRLEGVTKEYGEEVVTRVLHGIDLTLEQGEFAALIGPSGSGSNEATAHFILLSPTR